jgi:hypothetical protein
MFAPVAVSICHVVIAGVCCIYDPGLIWGFRGIPSIGLLVLSIFLLWRCTGDPGFLTIPSSFELAESAASLESPQTGRLELPIKSRTEENVQLRFCTICQLTQPIRTKHCSDCNACVRTYDHHCPWIGTCVGELNRYWFLTYLWGEFFTLVWFFLNSLGSILVHAGDRSKLGQMALLIFAIMVMSVFLLMTGLLGMYHIFLCVTNLTTWEHSSWHKITYLEDLKESRGSPFAHPTIGGNVKMYFSIPGWVERDDQGWIVWRRGTQHRVVGNFFRNCCDSC